RSGLEVEQHKQHVHPEAIAGKRQKQTINVIGRGTYEVCERLKRMQRLPRFDHPIVLLEDNRMDLEEPDILEGPAGAVLAAGSDNVGADEAVAVAPRVAEDVNQHRVRQKFGRYMQGV